MPIFLRKVTFKSDHIKIFRVSPLSTQISSWAFAEHRTRETQYSLSGFGNRDVKVPTHWL